MVAVTQAIPAHYAIASQKVASGKWRVDPNLGLVYGPRGQAFCRTNTDGYVQIKFRDPENWRVERAVLAHRVIWESVHGPLAVGLTINHRNGVKTDNRLANLEAVTQAANRQHAVDTGLAQGLAGTAHPRAMLTDEQVLAIYRRAWAGEKSHLIGQDYGVGGSIVRNIKQGHAWSHLTGHRRA